MIQGKIITRKASLIVAVLALSSLNASAQNRASDTILRGSMQALQTAGFVGASDVHVVDVAPARPTSTASTDETVKALSVLADLVDKSPEKLEGQIARGIGFEFAADYILLNGYPRQKSSDGIRHFSTTSVNGKLDILIEESWKVDGRTTLISCRVTPQGVIESATRTTKPNGQFQFEKIPLPEGEAGCREILDFWTKYYLDNLKPTLKQ
jgi:hypothetical protein